MKILVNGTEKELKAIGKNGVEWTNDLLGNHGALHYDEDVDQYFMTTDEFEWWELVIDMLNQIGELEDKLDDDARAEYEAEGFTYSDLDDEVRARLEWLKSV